MQVAFTKPCLVKGIVKKASMEVRPWIASSLLSFYIMAPQHLPPESACGGFASTPRDANMAEYKRYPSSSELAACNAGHEGVI